MSQNGNTYIIPVPSNDKNLKQIKKDLRYTSGEFIYRADERNSARIIYYEKYINETTRIIVFKDEDENNAKRKNYKYLMDLKGGNYTQEYYDRYCEWWGVYFLQTNNQESAVDIYSDYKKRWSIETYNNYIKNDASFNDLKLQDYYVEHGFNFIMLIAGLIHSRFNNSVKQLKKSSISTFDVLIKAGHMRMALEGEQWKLHNTRRKDLDLLNLLGYTPERTLNTST